MHGLVPLLNIHTGSNLYTKEHCPRGCPPPLRPRVLLLMMADLLVPGKAINKLGVSAQLDLPAASTTPQGHTRADSPLCWSRILQ